MSQTGSSSRKARFILAAISEERSLEQLSELIGHQQDEGWSAGDAYTRLGKSKIYRFSRWTMYVDAEGDENDWELAIDHLLARLETLNDRFRTLPAEVVIKLEVNLTEVNDVFGFGLSTRHIEALSGLRASLEISVVVGALSDPL